MAVIYSKIKLHGSKGQKKLEALFDSGASDSMIKSELGDLLANFEKIPEPLSFETAKEGEYITITDRIVLDFYIDGIRLSDEFLIVDGLSEDVIIGASTMQKWRLKLDFEQDRVIVDQRVTRKILK